MRRGGVKQKAIAKVQCAGGALLRTRASTRQRSLAMPHSRDHYRRTNMANPFVHVELNTTNVATAKTFYSKLFDWKLEDIPMDAGVYTMISVGDGTGGGLMQHPVPNAPSLWLAYVLVDDIDAATKKARSLGASVVKDVTEIAGMGWLSIIVDPTGAMLGLWKPAGK
jgi:uncharacterized protein